MNKRQQEIIDNLEREFNKLQPVGGKSFNLINTQPLIEKSNAIEQIKKEEELSSESWIKAAQIETRRIVELLSDDLPTLEVAVFGSWNDTVLIRKPGRDDLRIYVRRKSEDIKNEELGIYVRHYLSLEYSTNLSTSFIADTIEEVLGYPIFLETLRKLL